MPKKNRKKSSIQNKSLYIYLALVTMTVVHFFAKPFKKGVGILKRRLQQASQRKNSNLHVQLLLGQDRYSAPNRSLPVQLKGAKKGRAK